MNNKQAKTLRRALDYKTHNERKYKATIYKSLPGLNKQTFESLGKHRIYRICKRAKKLGQITTFRNIKSGDVRDLTY